MSKAVSFLRSGASRAGVEQAEKSVSSAAAQLKANREAGKFAENFLLLSLGISIVEYKP